MKTSVFFILCLAGFRAGANCTSLFASPVSFPSGKSSQALIAIDTYFRDFAKAGHLLLFRGQRILSKTLMSTVAQEKGIAGSAAYLENALVDKAREVDEERVCLEKAIKDLGHLPQYLELFTRKQTELESLSALEMVAIAHSGVMGAESCFVSTTSSIYAAAGAYQGGYSNRYIFVLLVPETVPVRTFEARRKKRAEDAITSEMEYSIPHEATEFVLGLVDTQTGQCLMREQSRTTAKDISG